jgi:sulfatase maturation enzyme AslB (radical SAM superfamily)
VPGVLLSGGEPLIHPRFFDLARYARGQGVRLTLSTNGTLIDRDAARRLKDTGFAYVGISLDGIGATHDHFRGRQGAFDKTVFGFPATATGGRTRIGTEYDIVATLTPHRTTTLEVGYSHLDGGTMYTPSQSRDLDFFYASIELRY